VKSEELRVKSIYMKKKAYGFVGFIGFISLIGLNEVNSGVYMKNICQGSGVGFRGWMFFSARKEG